MGISMGECGAGGLVWVQRKNGTWWPGRVLGPDELRCIYRSENGGIAVKLLDKPDASVEWFNLERSKCIKAFRCGEFDDCIAKAESSQGHCINSRKYVSRAYAILHALQLEKQEVMKRHKRPGEEFKKPVCCAKRSRRVYLPNKSSNCSSTISDHQSSILQPQVVVRESPVQSSSTGRNTVSRSRGCKSLAVDFRKGEKEESVKQSSGPTEMRNPHACDEQGGSGNSKEQNVQSYSSDFLLKDQLAGFVKVQKRNVQAKMKVQISRKLPVVFYNRKHIQEDLMIDCSSKAIPKTKSTLEMGTDLHLQGQGSQYLEPLDKGGPNMLIDIAVAVQARYRGEHVPLVSLMSRLNGRAIIGHPIEIQASEISDSDINIPQTDDAGPMKSKPVWRTSKRTPVCYITPPHKPVEATDKSDQSNLKSKENNSPQEQESLLKPLKKRELPDQYRVNGGNLKHPLQRCMKDELKSCKNATTQVNCVPMELVFRKLYEAVGHL